MANKPILAEPARNDLKDIWTFIADRNPNSADKFIREFAKKFQLLADNPKIGRTHDEFLLDIRTFPFKDYVIFYFSTENGGNLSRSARRTRY